VLLERGFNICLDLVLLVIPLTVMAAAYALIVSKLWKGLKREIQHSNQRNNPGACRRF
jgi:cholecystokinin A receptor